MRVNVGGNTVSVQVRSSGIARANEAIRESAASQVAAASSAAAALVSENAAQADAVATAADRVQTGLDRAATAADRVQTGADAAAAAASEASVASTAGSLLTGVTGTPTNVGYDTVTTNGLLGLSAVESAVSYSYVYQPMAFSVPAGGKAVVYYRGTVTGAGVRISLFRPGTGIISATPALTLDDTLRSITLTNTHGSLAATYLCLDSNGVSSWELLRIVLPGDPTETTATVGPSVNVLMTALSLMTREVIDTEARAIGLQTTISTNSSMDTLEVNGVGDLGFVESSGSASYARSPIVTQAVDAKCTLIYRARPRSDTAPISGSLQATLEYGGGAASSTHTLVLDGALRMHTFTATQAATRILWQAALVNARVNFALISGDPAETAPSQSGTQAAILALANALARPFNDETWTTPDKRIFWPTPVAFVTGRDATIYGRQVVSGRYRQFGLDVCLVSAAAESANHPGFNRFLTPDLMFKGEQLGGDSCFIDVRDPLLPAQMLRKAFTRRMASASQTGTVLVCVLGDSTAALALNALKQRVNASGATFSGVGTLTSGGIGYEGRSGWTALNYLGKSRPAANPFLRALSVAVPGELAIITANPTVCFADDAGYGTGVRPSYAEDNTKSSYSMFDWNYWRQNVAVGLTGTEKLRAVMQLGRNGTSSATFVADNELAQNHIVENFRSTFANGTMFVVSETVGQGNDTVNFLTAPEAYRDRTAPLIAMKLRKFSNREADRVWLVPAWAMQNAYAAMKLNTASSTDTDTGTTTHTINDVVHYEGETAIQWAEAMLGPLLYIHETT